VAVTTNRAAIATLIVLLGVGVILRVMALEVDGHNGDVRVTASWAERMAEVGPWGFYDGSGSIYPALLYPLWAVGALLDGPALDLAIKGFSIPFDVGVGLLLFGVLWRRGARWAAVGASGLYLLNPAAILAGPVWGQLDSAGTLPYLGALVAAAAGRHGLAGSLAVVATLVKPQFGLVLLPVLGVAFLQARRIGDLAPIGRALGGMAVASIIVFASVALDPIRYIGLLGDTAVRQPSTSLNAFNPWGLLVGFKVPDDPYVGLGTLLLVIGVIGALSGLRRRPDLAVVLAVGAALVLAFYLLPTRVHERYLFPAIALLAPFAVAGRAPLLAYIGLSAAFAASLLYALHDTTPFTLPEPVATWMTSDGGVWTVGLVLIGSAAAWAWLLLVRLPRLPDGTRLPEA
jgi:dolichyl-phosphate-mannose-protein mannosyltransferase